MDDLCSCIGMLSCVREGDTEVQCFRVVSLEDRARVEHRHSRAEIASYPLDRPTRLDDSSFGIEITLIVVEDEAEAHYIEGCSAPKYGTSSLHAGCVEIYVGKHAKMRYSSVENWSVDTYNLNTKRAIVETGGSIEWV